MTKARITETDSGITGEFNTQMYDLMMRNMRDKGWIETDAIIKSGIDSGLALEIGPGPGYLGLEWLKKTNGTHLKGMEISPDMINIAKRNTKEYGLEDRADYVNGDAQKMPFDDNMFDAVFTSGSLHEWSEPLKIFNEVSRILKPNGRFFVSDLRRDMNVLMKSLMWLMTNPKEIRPGLITSINASYTVAEITDILKQSGLVNFEIKQNTMGFDIAGQKKSD